MTYPGEVHCRHCGARDTRVIDSRVVEDGASIRRRRACPDCGSRFTTFERAEEVPLTVQKRNGRREPFSAAKVTSGIALAVKGRPITGEQVADIVAAVENALRVSAEPLTTQAIGEMVSGVAQGSRRRLGDAVCQRVQALRGAGGFRAGGNRTLRALRPPTAERGRRVRRTRC